MKYFQLKIYSTAKEIVVRKNSLQHEKWQQHTNDASDLENNNSKKKQ